MGRTSDQPRSRTSWGRGLERALATSADDDAHEVDVTPAHERVRQADLAKVVSCGHSRKHATPCLSMWRSSQNVRFLVRGWPSQGR